MNDNRNRREAILDAAHAMAREKGFAGITLDAVSKKARLSKGGLLYHFRNKESLLVAVVERLCSTEEAARRKKADELPPSAGRELKAHIMSAGARDPQTDRMAAALLAAGAYDSRLLKPASVALGRLLRDAEKAGIRRELATTIAAALDGMWILRLLGVLDLSRKQFNEIIRLLLKLVDEEEVRTST